MADITNEGNKSSGYTITNKENSSLVSTITQNKKSYKLILLYNFNSIQQNMN